MPEKNIQVDTDFQDLFLRSPLGPRVLGKIVDEVDLLNIADNAEAQIAQNEVKIILTRAGIGLGMTGEQYVRALAGKKLENVKEDEDNEQTGD